uniref:Retrovirus-related Pol polyprotein from transposon TNT 1-94-like beta-barrel domain-containing protein n=1 Tax=Nelumbo nucifera TaxID=4432 RepID=A0A822YD45_NELNU|nr:TPA_asm: hypothetical protein HUJ06_030687 [Nelumbo nucifera]
MRRKPTFSDSESLTAKDSGYEHGRSKEMGDKKNRSRSKSKLKKTQRKWCKKDGYWLKDCKKFAKAQKKKGKATNEASVTSNTENDGDLFTISLVMDSLNTWIHDSGCSYHMCPYRDWFSTYESHVGGTILMGNNDKCKTIGIGTIKIKMFDEIVRHVPNLKKSSVSLGALDDLGCTYSGTDVVIKVKMDAMVFIIREKK